MKATVKAVWVRAGWCAAALHVLAGGARAQPGEGLAPFFGFRESRIVKVDEDCGPVAVGDFNGDGRPDLAVVNNRKSRIEIHYLRAAAREAEELQRITRANELPPNPWYDREQISVAHRVNAVRAFDVDNDGKLDIVYAGTPAEIVVMRQETPAMFRLYTRERVKDLAGSGDILAIADVSGGPGAEVLAIAGGRVAVYPMDGRGRLGTPRFLGSGASSDQVRSIAVADYDGDGRSDVLGVVPDDASPVRLWLQTQTPGATEKDGLLASELRFELPQIRAAGPVRFPGRKAASIATLERSSNRLALYDLAVKDIPPPPEGVVAEREVQAEVTSFESTGGKGRSVVTADVTGDGMDDLVTTDQKGNAVVVYRQEAGLGLASASSFAAFKAPKQVDVGRWFEGAGVERPQVFTLSEEEKTLGYSTVGEGDRLEFPIPVALKTAGGTPLVMELFEIGGTPALAVVVKQNRDYVLELFTRKDADGAEEGGGPAWSANVATLALKDLRRDPAAILPFDYDRDGATDLLVLTPGEPMMMVRTGEKEGAPIPETVLTKDTMPQFGLVQAAGPENTALLDVDGDGHDELLIADANFVRFASYDTQSGWSVVDQVNIPDPTTQLAGVALMGEGAGGGAGEGATTIVASDKANGRLLMLGKNEAGRWALRERVRILGFPVGAIRAGAFAGEPRPSVLAISDDAFALVRLGGQRPGLEQFASFTAESEDRVQHDMASGDLNSDGFVDVVVLDAGEQMCQIVTFTAARKAMAATEFKVFESRLFSRGDTREAQPSDAIVTDVTGDGHPDLVLLVHDRVIVYPQMAEGPAGEPAAGIDAPAEPRPVRRPSLAPEGPN